VASVQVPLVCAIAWICANAAPYAPGLTMPGACLASANCAAIVAASADSRPASAGSSPAIISYFSRALNGRPASHCSVWYSLSQASPPITPAPIARTPASAMASHLRRSVSHAFILPPTQMDERSPTY
jgi:hypothetical protein